MGGFTVDAQDFRFIIHRWRGVGHGTDFCEATGKRCLGAGFQGFGNLIARFAKMNMNIHKTWRDVHIPGIQNLLNSLFSNFFSHFTDFTIFK